ncbi:SDR family oxidoreductase [Phytohabitans sp. ZYX-F-186]|uniref:SDR family oxidoreductase n=1 Tax=Phytohabitans maris TaxID=3071409 RepID=A0ABU0Z9Q9_9ACTN|nr:SDR family NAD(P)-dependent oxidoreductase [Phytohabitans sp. ZYX-F-186]MDQ7903728.1 SDR family oxidoreductase [Phytohabitans sp. ZYX-F-186]
MSGLFDLTGRVAVVVGGSRGMGRSMCLALAGAGADVMVVSRRLESCVAVAEEIAATTGRRAVPYACHIGHWDEATALADAAYETFGRVDVLVNNAGMSPVYDNVAEVSEELYDKVLAVNLKGPFRLTALVGTRMAAGDGGSIVFVSSVSSVRGGHGAIPYAAAKAGVNSLAVQFAHEFGPKVRVNCVMPGAFLTDIAKHWDPDEFARNSQRYALRRGAQPDEIMGTILYLAGDASSYTTGAVIEVHGGHP